MTEDELLDGLLVREGGFVDHPADRGGPTKYGITARTLGEWRSLHRPATADEVRAMTTEEARAIYRRRYVQPFAAVQFEELRVQLVDFAVTSGVGTAIRTLQRVLGVIEDGILGDRTREALTIYPWKLTNGALVAARVRLFVRLVERDPRQKAFLFGWMRRAISFMT